MIDKDALKILTEMIEKYPLTAKEKEAVLAAVGVLGWTSLGESRLKNIIKSKKARQERDLQ